MCLYSLLAALLCDGVRRVWFNCACVCFGYEGLYEAVLFDFVCVCVWLTCVCGLFAIDVRCCIMCGLFRVVVFACVCLALFACFGCYLLCAVEWFACFVRFCV